MRTDQEVRNLLASLIESYLVEYSSNRDAINTLLADPESDDQAIVTAIQNIDRTLRTLNQLKIWAKDKA